MSAVPPDLSSYTPGTPNAQPLRTFFDAIPTEARTHIDYMKRYSTTFLPRISLSDKFPQLVPKVAVSLHPRRGDSPLSVKKSKIGRHIY